MEGSKFGVNTDSGPGFVKVNYFQKTWSGGDYPKRRPIYVKVYYQYATSRLRVREGKRYIEIRYKNRFYKIRHQPPPRVFTEHDYEMQSTKVNDGIITYQLPGRTTKNTGTHENCGFGGASVVSFWNSNNELKLIDKLREKVAGSDFNAAIFLGEGKEALNMITNAATRIYQGYRAARRGDFKRARAYLVNGTERSMLGRKSAANNWLELQYGWLPLLKDAEGAVQFLAHHLYHPLQFIVRVGSLPVGGLVNTPSPSNTRWASASTTTRGSIKAILTEKASAPKLLGFHDPASLAWELLPYSFVLDWFLPIGSYLSARGLSQSLTGTFVSSTVKKTRCSGIVAVNPGLTISGATYTYEANSLKRVVSTTLQVPVPTMKSFNQAFSWKRAANAVALLSQLR